MTLTEATLTEITHRLVATHQPAYRKASARYRGLFGLGVPCDVWVRTREEVLREAPLSTTLMHKIIRERRVLHG